RPALGRQPRARPSGRAEDEALPGPLPLRVQPGRGDGGQRSLGRRRLGRRTTPAFARRPRRSPDRAVLFRGSAGVPLGSPGGLTRRAPRAFLRRALCACYAPDLHALDLSTLSPLRSSAELGG